VLDLGEDDGSVLLKVKVTPGASQTRYLGEWNGRARIAVAAPPEKGRANRALLAFLAEILSVRDRDLTLVAGHGSHLKTVKIEAIGQGTVRAAFQSRDS
jgi:uncharacterized protein (TIGR00251 family)